MAGELITPYGLDAYDGHVYVCDNGNHRVSVHSTSDGSYERAFDGGWDAFALTQPRDCAVVRARSRAEWLVVTEATRVQVLAIQTGEPVQVRPACRLPIRPVPT